jgi:plastocyanin
VGGLRVAASAAIVMGVGLIGAPLVAAQDAEPTTTTTATAPVDPGVEPPPAAPPSTPSPSTAPPTTDPAATTTVPADPTTTAPGPVEAVGGGATSPAVLADAAVDVQDAGFSGLFSPASVTIVAGDQVVWTQSGTNPHTVTASDGSFDSHPNCPPPGDCMVQGETFAQTFTTPGTYGYYCKLHGTPDGLGMAGVVNVEQPTTTTAPPGGGAPTTAPGSGGAGGSTGSGSSDGASTTGLPQTGLSTALLVGLGAGLVVSGVMLRATAARRADPDASR